MLCPLPFGEGGQSGAVSFRLDHPVTQAPYITMKTTLSAAFGIFILALTSCQTGETLATGTTNTVGNAAQGVGRTARTLGTGTVNTVGNTAATAGSGIADRDLNKATVGTVKAAGQGVGTTAVGTGKSHLKTSSGVLKDTGKTVTDTAGAAEKRKQVPNASAPACLELDK